MFLKVSYNKEIHILSSKPSFSQLLAFVKTHFLSLPTHFEITYTDEDGDKIAVTNDHDIEAMFEVNTSKFVKLEIMPASETVLELHDESTTQTFDVNDKSSILPTEASVQIVEKEEEKPKEEEEKPKEEVDIPAVVPEVTIEQVPETKAPQNLEMPVEVKATAEAVQDSPKEDQIAQEKPAEPTTQQSVPSGPSCPPGPGGFMFGGPHCGRFNQGFRPPVPPPFMGAGFGGSQGFVPPPHPPHHGFIPPFKGWAPPHPEHHGKFEFFKNKARDFVKEAVSELVPEIVKQVRLSMENPKSDQPVEAPVAGTETVTHNNVRCDHCGVSPIVGIRYKCMECHNFDLCEKCEQINIHPPHDFIKMRKPKNCGRFGFGSGFGRCPWGYGRRRSSSSKDQNETSTERRTRKLVKWFGGKSEDYTQFAAETKGMRPREAVHLYHERTGTQYVQCPERAARKANKLACIFQKPVAEIEELMKNNPGKNFWELKEMLKQQTVVVSEVKPVAEFEAKPVAVPEPVVVAEVKPVEVVEPVVVPKPLEKISTIKTEEPAAEPVTKPVEVPAVKDKINVFPEAEQDRAQKQKVLDDMIQVIGSEVDLRDFVRKNYKQGADNAIIVYYEQL